MIFVNSFSWIGLMIGNSRLHWAWFVDGRLKHTWDMPHLSLDAIAQLVTHQLDLSRYPELLPSGDCPTALPPAIPVALPLYFASVVPAQIPLWQTYTQAHLITLDQVPLQGLYPTLGIDRALALYGAVQHYGQPMLVIDAGTALTLTAADETGHLLGGAILPGLQLQLRSLGQQTAALPTLETAHLRSLPSRWALTTPEAIHSGVIYTLLAGLQDFIEAWWQQCPAGQVVWTGGDSSKLLGYLHTKNSAIAAASHYDPNLIFQGMGAIVQAQMTQETASNSEIDDSLGDC